MTADLPLPWWLEREWDGSEPLGNAIAMMLENPTAIRRPVMETDQGLIVGFDREEWERAFPDR